MKVLGTYQFQQKKFKLMGLTGEFAPHLGNIPFAFQMIVFGNSGNGKTEYCIRLAKTLASYGKVAWISYEQGHGFDLQQAINRNRMDEVNGQFYVIDPNESRDHSKTYIEELYEYLDKRNSPDFIFVDSVDYTRFTWDDYILLKNTFKRKTFIFISHAAGKRPKSSIGERILYDGGIGVFIDKYIGFVIKNRFGGFEDFLVWEAKAREVNPAYFLARLKGQNKPKQGDLFDKNTAETPEKMHVPPPETMGVRAENTPKPKAKKAPKTPVEQ
ncbi:hypothetical protein FW774_17225 [Pedobacter sp. BS3]|uniref:hypothetical protein n=1 Tax=Pedobacter sp. BS3 TaxID=2567937 RepID=UPI0011EE8F73|nr:hypothetical protein [Pedobacter sp. BS3]TZF81798.1 hypothetical protein FW774_17225 [Pedobacter sp. BS3]